MNIDIKKGKALVLVGGQGSGKSALAEEIAERYGPYATIEAADLDRLRDIGGALQGEPATLIVEGLPATEKAFAEVKAILTSDQVVISRKGKQPTAVKAPNIIFCTGYVDAVPVSFNDRRFTVVQL